MLNPYRAPTVEAARDLFWKQGDFGYVRERLSEMETLCAASRPVSSLISSVPQDAQESTGTNSSTDVVHKDGAKWTQYVKCLYVRDKPCWVILLLLFVLQ